MQRPHGVLEYDGEGDCGKGYCVEAHYGKDDCVGRVNGYHCEEPQTGVKLGHDMCAGSHHLFMTLCSKIL